MAKILEAIKMFKQDMQELDNAEKLNQITPYITMCDIHHQFLYNKHYSNQTGVLFDQILEKEPYASKTALNYKAYTEENAQNKVLIHGVLFNSLFNVYLNHFKKGFDNVLLTNLPERESDDMCYFLSKERPGSNRTIIDFIEYEKLPKRYRCLFVQYDDDHYTLNIPHAEMMIAYNKKNKSKIEKLLLRAKMLIPVIYKEQPLNSVVDPTSAKRVSNEQLNTVRELHDIFVEIAKITFPVETDTNAKSRDVYNEYIHETNQKDTVLSACRMDKEDKQFRDNAINEERKNFISQKKAFKQQYKNNRATLLQSLAENISVRIK